MSSLMRYFAAKYSHFKFNLRLYFFPKFPGGYAHRPPGKLVCCILLTILSLHTIPVCSLLGSALEENRPNGKCYWTSPLQQAISAMKSIQQVKSMDKKKFQHAWQST